MIKIYLCVAILNKGSQPRVFTVPIRATSEEDAMKKFVANELHEFLIKGYTIAASNVSEIHPTICPLNNSSDFALLSDIDDRKHGLFIRLDKQHPEEFKKDLQALVNKYCQNLPPIFD